MPQRFGGMTNSQPYASEIDQQCRIDRGALVGLTGTIKQSNSDGRIIVRLDGLCGVFLSVPPDLVKSPG
jgi:hypothetical protein